MKITSDHIATAHNINFKNPPEHRRELAAHILDRYKSKLTPQLKEKLIPIKDGRFLFSPGLVSELEEMGVSL